MSSDEQFDAIVIGAGQAGPGIATHLVAKGQRVALIEQDKVGGTCLNRGCRPTKAMRASARVAHLARTARQHGVDTGAVTVDFTAVMARKDELVDGWVNGYAELLGSTEGLTLLHGEGRMAGTADHGHRVALGDRILTAPKIFLNVGTRSTEPAIDGLDDVPWLDNDRVLHLDALPEHLVILGGSYIALEMGQMFRRFGSDVTLIERGPRLVSREDPAISQEITRFLTAEAVTVCTSTRVARVEPTTPGVRVITDPSGTIEGSHLLVAIGRTPNTDSLDLHTVGVKTDGRGYIPTDGSLRTSVDGIWALGDINGRGAFTHTSYQDHEIVIDGLEGGSRSADGRIPTYAVFTDPPLGRVGMNEEQARASGRNVLKATTWMKDVTRAQLDGETDGLITVLVDADTDRFLGAAALGISGDEIVQVVSALMHADASCHVLAQMLPIHPTVAEFYPTILSRLQPLHD